jgi:hypothetical protein
MFNNAVLYATLRAKRAPVSDRLVCFKLRVANALPVHTFSLHEEDISDLATVDQLQRTLDALCKRFRCGRVELDAHRSVMKKLEANG